MMLLGGRGEVGCPRGDAVDFVDAPALTPAPLPQAVWTGDMGNTCARTWVTVQSPV
ncbi:protein of unknown function (plasmid) [Cupriavidus taiwanensis]|uniref:Uncharacterized protein n=1 Tax=Cupriavidus taiwanensis TaxID=164546 RepID=A0A375IKM6_9BURK|nr:protein of unknown function [Cupriavidus taiwanensis]